MNLSDYKLPRITPEMIEEASRDAYREDRNYPENFSNWFPHIIDSGKFNISSVISNQIFSYEEVQQMQHTDLFDKVDWDLMNKILQPTLCKMKPNVVYSIKNGCFSNKFEFSTCLATKENLAKQLWKINYMSSMYSTGGYTELVVRDYIPFDHMKVATIYSGMPLREEMRVFYNMDTSSIEYIVDYWDYDYCELNIRDMTDKIVFNWFHNKFGNRLERHNDILHIIEDEIKDNINTLKFDGVLSGIWSIDFMYVNDEQGFDGVWLIDMARAEKSAYWNFDRLTPETKIKFGGN